MYRPYVLVLSVVTFFAASVSAYGQITSEETTDSAAKIQDSRQTESSDTQGEAKGSDAGEGDNEAKTETQDTQDTSRDKPRDIFDDIEDDVRSGDFDQSCSIPVG